MSINDHVISAGLNVELDPAQTDAPALALSEAEQRRLLDRVDRLAESMLSAASGGSIERLRQSVELLLMTTLRDLVRQGCQSAFNIDPQSACKIDPPEWHGGGCPGSQ